MGKLRLTGGRNVAGAEVRLQRRHAGSSRWVTVGTDTTDRSGVVTLRQRVRRTAYFRWVLDGSGDLAATRSDRVRARR